MTPTELRALILASGLSQQEMARRIGIGPRTMRRMLAGETPIMPRTITAIRLLLGGAGSDTRGPRDAWIIGEGPPPERREYIIHTTSPRFIARIVAIDIMTDEPEPDEDPVDTMSGVVYEAGDSVICEIAWIDPAPADPTVLRCLLDEAAEQLEWDAP